MRNTLQFKFRHTLRKKVMNKRPTTRASLVAILVSLLVTLVTPASANDLSQELARARAATAKYHDVTQAEADGYQFDSCHESEACHWFNWDLYDGTFDPEHPEALLYVPTRDGGWRLVGVEYVVLGTDPPQPAPEGFTGDEDDEYWRFFTEGFADWELTAWIWFNNPDGTFEMENPRLGEEEEEH